MKNKKIKRSDIGSILKIFINEELKLYNMDYDYIVKNEELIKEEHGDDWYRVYTFNSQQQYVNWKTFCINFLINGVTPKFTKQQALKEFAMIDLSYGLKHNFE